MIGGRQAPRCWIDAVEPYRYMADAKSTLTSTKSPDQTQSRLSHILDQHPRLSPGRVLVTSRYEARLGRPSGVPPGGQAGTARRPKTSPRTQNQSDPTASITKAWASSQQQRVILSGKPHLPKLENFLSCFLVSIEPRS